MTLKSATNPEGKNGFLDDATNKFYPVEMFQKGSTPEGKAGYWNQEFGYIESKFPQDKVNEPAKVVDYNRQESTIHPPGAGDQVTPPTGPGLSGRITTRLENRGENLTELFNRRASNIPTAIARAPELAFQTAGQAAGSAFDIAGELVSSTYQTFIPDSIKEEINEKTKGLLNTSFGKAGIKALEAGSEAYQKFSDQYPDAAMAIEGTFNIATLGLVRSGTKIIATEVKNTGKDAIAGLSKSVLDIRNKPLMVENINKQLARSNRQNLGSLFNVERKELPNISSAIDEIIANKATLKLSDIGEDVITGALPKNKWQLAQAIEQADKINWEKSATLRKAATEQGVTVSFAKPIKTLENIANDPYMIKNYPATVKILENKVEIFKQNPKWSIDDTQRYLTDLNAEHRAILEKADTHLVGTANSIKALMSDVKSSLDTAVDSVKGANHAELKQNMFNLRTLAEYVDPKTTRMSKKNASAKLAIDSIKTGIYHARGHTFGATHGMIDIAKDLKTLGSQADNKLITSMFGDAEKLITKRDVLNGVFEPQSLVGKLVNNILARGGNRAKVIKELKKANVPEPTQVAIEMTKRFKGITSR